MNEEVMQEIKRESLFERKFETILLSIITAAVLGMFGFLWNINAKIAVLEERDRVNANVIGELQANINTLRLDVADLKIKVGTMEVSVNKRH